MSFEINEERKKRASKLAKVERAQELKAGSPKDSALAAERATLEEERIYRRGTVSVRDIIAPAGFEVQFTHLLLNGQFVRTLFVTTYPRYVGLGWAAPIINYKGALDIALHFYPVKAEVILKQLRDKVGIIQAQISSDNDTGKPRDPIQETALRDVEQLRYDLTQWT